MQETPVQSLGLEDALEKKRQLTPVLLPGKFRGQRSLVSYLDRVHGVAKSQTELSTHASVGPQEISVIKQLPKLCHIH